MATDTYLEMVSDVIMETGLNGGNAPSSIATAAGDAKKVAYWLRVADLRIQRERIDWDFLWAKPTVQLTQNSNLVPLQQDPGNDSSDLNQHTWLINVIHKQSLAIIDANGQAYFPTWMSWPEFSVQYDYESTDTHDFPAFWSMSPARLIKLSTNIESAGMQCKYEYWRKPLRLRDDDDTSPIPDDYNRIIIVMTKIMYAEHEDAPEVSAGAHEEYEHLLNQMISVHTPESEWSRLQSSDRRLVVESR